MTERTTEGAGTSRAASVRDVAAEAGKQARAVAGDVSAAAREKGEELKQRAEETAREKKSQAAGMIGALATALHTAGQTLREQQQDDLGRLSDEIAEQAERVATRLEESDTSGMLDDLEQFGRRNPAAFLATAFVGGLLMGRFLRSASPERSAATAAATGGRSGVERERTPSVQRERAVPDTGATTTPLGGRASPATGGANE